MQEKANREDYGRGIHIVGVAHNEHNVLPSTTVTKVPDGDAKGRCPKGEVPGDAADKTPNQTPVTGSTLLPVSIVEGL